MGAWMDGREVSGAVNLSFSHHTCLRPRQPNFQHAPKHVMSRSWAGGQLVLTFAAVGTLLPLV